MSSLDAHAALYEMLCPGSNFRSFYLNLQLQSHNSYLLNLKTIMALRTPLLTFVLLIVLTDNKHNLIKCVETIKSRNVEC